MLDAGELGKTTPVEMFTTESHRQHANTRALSGRMVHPRGTVSEGGNRVQRHQPRAVAFSKKLAELGVAVTVWRGNAAGCRGSGPKWRHHVTAGGCSRCPWRHCWRELISAWMPPTLMQRMPPVNIRACSGAGVAWNTAACCVRKAPCRPAVRVFETAAQSANICRTEGNNLLATTCQGAGCVCRLEPARLYPRVLPTAGGIAACEAAQCPRTGTSLPFRGRSFLALE